METGIRRPRYHLSGGNAVRDVDRVQDRMRIGMYSTVAFAWGDAKKRLIINERKGSFSGMLSERKFSIVWVSKNKGVGMDPVVRYDKTVTYHKEEVVVKP